MLPPYMKLLTDTFTGLISLLHPKTYTYAKSQQQNPFDAFDWQPETKQIKNHKKEGKRE